MWQIKKLHDLIFQLSVWKKLPEEPNPEILFMVVASGKQDQGGAEQWKSLLLAMWIRPWGLSDDLTMGLYDCDEWPSPTTVVYSVGPDFVFEKAP